MSNARIEIIGLACPTCGTSYDGHIPVDATNPDNPDVKPPKEGDISVCMHCLDICVVQHGQFAKLRGDQRMDYVQQPIVLRAYLALAMLRLEKAQSQ